MFILKVIEAWCLCGTEEEQKIRTQKLDQLLPLIHWQNVTKENKEKFKSLFHLTTLPFSEPGTKPFQLFTCKKKSNKSTSVYEHIELLTDIVFKLSCEKNE